MIEILLLILFSAPAPVTQPIVTCTVTVSGVTCATRNPTPECQNVRQRRNGKIVGWYSMHPACRSMILDIPDAAWDSVFSEWTWKTEDHPSHWNFPLIKQRPSVGTKLKATLDENGQIVPLASCDVRVHRRVNEWAKAHPGDRVPGTMMEPPKDCGGGR